MTKSLRDIGLIIILILTLSCAEEEPQILPEISLDQPESISAVRAVMTSRLKKDGTGGVTRRGITFSIHPNPDLNDSVQEDQRFYGAFDYKLFDLLPNTTYYVRAFAQNSVGLTFSNELEITTEAGANYSLFDTGPGGGVIFIDMGSYENGWRYMEALPLDNPNHNNVFWFDHQYIPIGTFPGIGKGEFNSYKFNTQTRAINQLSSMQVLANMTSNGYKDWFLPSIEELAEVREKLHLNNLGGFEDDVYWSSTEKDDLKSIIMYFSTGLTFYEYKAFANKVIAVRLF